MNFTILGNSSQYVSLRDSHLFVECHIKEFNAMGTPLMMRDQPQPSQKRTAKEAFGTPEKHRRKRMRKWWLVVVLQLALPLGLN